MANEAPVVEEPAVADAGDGTPSWRTPPDAGASAPSVPKAPPVDPVAQPAPVPGATADQEVGWQKRLDSEVARRKALEDRLSKLEGGNAGGTPKADEPFKFEAYEGWKSKALSGPDGAAAAALFDGFHQAINADIARAVEGYVNDLLAPFSEWRKTSEVDGFYKTNPTASVKRDEIESLVGKYPGLPREEAWKIVNYGQTAGPSRTPKLPPPGSSPRTPGAPLPKGNPMRGRPLSEVIDRVMEEKGL